MDFRLKQCVNGKDGIEIKNIYEEEERKRQWIQEQREGKQNDR